MVSTRSISPARVSSTRRSIRVVCTTSSACGCARGKADEQLGHERGRDGLHAADAQCSREVGGLGIAPHGAAGACDVCGNLVRVEAKRASLVGETRSTRDAVEEPCTELRLELLDLHGHGRLRRSRAARPRARSCRRWLRRERSRSCGVPWQLLGVVVAAGAQLAPGINLFEPCITSMKYTDGLCRVNISIEGRCRTAGGRHAGPHLARATGTRHVERRRRVCRPPVPRDRKEAPMYTRRTSME